MTQNNIQARLYCEQDKDAWNAFVLSSVNGTFLFNRSFMDYHKDRFSDCSLVFTNKGRICGIFPASSVGDSVESHGGLTYGGLLVDAKQTSLRQIEMFDKACEYYRSHGFRSLLVKPVPQIYSLLPSEAQAYAMYRWKACKVGCSLSSAVDLTFPLSMHTLRRRGMARAAKVCLQILDDIALMGGFYRILESNLMSRHGVRPVHTLAEMEMLSARFPANVRLMTVLRADEVVAGAWLFVTKCVVHIQYIASNDFGKCNGALDYLFSYIMDRFRGNVRYLDFGISTEQDGKVLNEGLIFQKEGFGARPVVYDKWLVKL